MGRDVDVSPVQAKDRREAGDFARSLVGHLSSAMTVNALRLGQLLGLLEPLTNTWMTVAELAVATGTHQRHLTEWAGLLTTAGVLEADESGAEVRFHLPTAHAAALTLPTPYNISPMVAMATTSAATLEAQAETFRTGGGIGYADRVLDPDITVDALTRNRYDALLIDSYLGQVDELTARLTEGARVLELGCGRGHASRLIARAFPASTVVGLDISEAAIHAAGAAAAEAGLANASFVVGSATEPPSGPWDVIVALDVIHDLAEPFAALTATRAVLADDGRFVMIDSGAPPTLAERSELPWAPMMYGVSLAHCMSVSLAQGGEGLGAMWGREAVQDALARAGFQDVAAHQLKGNPMDLMYVASR
ncbi:class I SAM-dependent methyltransferase [Euzebya tangerina]|uniref:class I SAM-dependent methyltransferase n=1 Tax=Euzebya tangerina TaxID=591198 RepID=UPI000E30D422|nr:class I SAM-dependent methyltransferase [Euzebya tangerina]